MRFEFQTIEALDEKKGQGGRYVGKGWKIVGVLLIVIGIIIIAAAVATNTPYIEYEQPTGDATRVYPFWFSVAFWILGVWTFYKGRG